jgi:hypothetical protein
MSGQFIIKKAGDKGNGLFTTQSYPKGTIILKFEGITITRTDIKDFSGQAASCLLQIGPELYLDLKGDFSFFANHSCNPNTGIKVVANNAFLISIQDIKSGDELSYDYSTTSTEDNSTFILNCNCSKFKCRKLISGFDTLTQEQKQKYIDLGVVPKYLL